VKTKWKKGNSLKSEHYVWVQIYSTRR